MSIYIAHRGPPATTGDPVDNTLNVATLIAGTKARYRLRITISPTPPAFDAPVRGVPVGILLCLRYGKTRMVWLPGSEKNLMICLFVFTQLTNATDTRTHTQTDTA